MSESDRVIECPCGVILTGTDVDAVVDKARDHARHVHEMDLSEEDARAMSRPA
jgi:predicted small metal-binding protein